MKKTLEDLRKSGRKEVITYKGKGRRYSLSPGNIQWSSLPGAGGRGRGLGERGCGKGGWNPGRWPQCSFWGFVFSSVRTRGQEVLLLSF